MKKIRSDVAEASVCIAHVEFTEFIDDDIEYDGDGDVAKMPFADRGNF